MDPTELKNNLAYFTGTESWHKWNPLAHNYLLTDGALYLAQEAGAFWLMDLIASYYPKVKAEPFQVWKLHVDKDGGALASCEDGNGELLITQEIEFTDFPLESIKLYCEQAEPPYWVILLPLEH